METEWIHLGWIRWIKSDQERKSIRMLSHTLNTSYENAINRRAFYKNGSAYGIRSRRYWSTAQIFLRDCYFAVSLIQQPRHFERRLFYSLPNDFEIFVLHFRTELLWNSSRELVLWRFIYWWNEKFRRLININTILVDM